MFYNSFIGTSEKIEVKIKMFGKQEKYDVVSKQKFYLVMCNKNER